MARLSIVATLNRTIKKLQSERAKYVAKIAELQAKVDEIDSIFSKAGLGAKPAGKTAGTKVAGGGRKRGNFSVTAEESILAFVKSAGKPSTKEINEHWTKEGRGGKADNTLTRLVKEGKLKRIKADDVRGSRYAIA